MRIVFIGSSRLGLRALNAIFGLNDLSVVGVITNPETFKISYSKQMVRNVLHADLVQWANERNVACYVMTQNMLEPNLKDWLMSIKPDLMVLVGWYHMLPKVLRDIAPAVGLHASLLPDYSGGAPLVWAIINGEKTTGITLFQIGDGVDNGHIFGQKSIPIEAFDTIATLLEKAEVQGCELLREKLPYIFQLKPVAQDESQRRFFPQRSPSDGAIDWMSSARQVYDFIRAQTKPYPGAFTFFQNRKIIIWSAKVKDLSIGGVQGAFKSSEDGFIVNCGNSTSIEVTHLCDELMGDISATEWIKVTLSSAGESAIFTERTDVFQNVDTQMLMREFKNRT